METKIAEVETKAHKLHRKFNPLTALTGLFFATTLIFLVLSLFFFNQIHSFKQSALEARQKFTQMENERNLAVTTAEGLRADLVSYDAMAKRLEIEKKRAADFETKLKEKKA